MIRDRKNFMGFRRRGSGRGRRGFSMIELAIVLGVAGIVIGGVWVSMSGGSAKAKTMLALEQIIALNKNIRGFYQRQACIPLPAANDLTPILAALNPPAIPREMILGAGAVSPWAQPFLVRRIGVAGCGTIDAFRYVLQYQNLPPDACINLVAQATGPGEVSRGIAGAAINGVAVVALPPNVSAISGAGVGQCGENPTALVELTYNARMGE